MKPFHTIAIPHRDILEGNLSMDVFAADLWQVFKQDGPTEYKDSEEFFRKTYLTKGLKLGTRAATSIFLYSFSGGIEKGATKNEIKRVATTLDNPSSVVGEALDELKNSLFYLQFMNEKYFFTAEPNLNRIIVTKTDNISNEKTTEFEKDLLKKNINNNLSFIAQKTFIWTDNSSNIPDTPEFKLIILKEQDNQLMKTIIETKGNSPRVNTNNIFFLTPLESKKFDLIKFLKKAIALDEIINDPTLNLNDSQKLEINSMIGKIKNDYKDMLRDSYRLIFIPQKDGFKEEDLGSPIYGDSKAINEEVFEHLLNKGEILRRIAPIVLENKFLKNNDYVKILQIYKSSLKTKGETRFLDINVLLDSVKEGIRNKLFGLAFDRNNEIECIDTESAIINEEYYIVNIDYYNEHFKGSSD